MKHISKLIILLAFLVSSNAWGYPYVDSETYLMKAAKEGNLMVVNWLLKSGANVNDTYRWGITALNQSVASNNTDVVKALLKAGANSVDEALYYAAASSNVDIIKALIEAGADVDNIKNYHDYTPLMAAARNGKTENVKALLAAGADPNFKNRFGDIAIHEALNHGYIEIIKVLTAADLPNSPTVAVITSINKMASNLIKINWDVNKNNIKAFKLEYRASDSDYIGEWKSHIVANGSRTFYLYGLDLTKNYYITIKVKTNNGWSTQHGVVLKEIIN